MLMRFEKQSEYSQNINLFCYRGWIEMELYNMDCFNILACIFT